MRVQRGRLPAPRPQAQSRYEDTEAAGSPVGRVAAQFGGEDAERLGAPVPLQEKRTFSARQAPVRYPVRNGPTVVAVSQRPESGCRRRPLNESERARWHPLPILVTNSQSMTGCIARQSV